MFSWSLECELSRVYELNSGGFVTQVKNGTFVFLANFSGGNVCSSLKSNLLSLLCIIKGVPFTVLWLKISGSLFSVFCNRILGLLTFEYFLVDLIPILASFIFSISKCFMLMFASFFFSFIINKAAHKNPVTLKSWYTGSSRIKTQTFASQLLNTIKTDVKLYEW